MEKQKQEGKKAKEEAKKAQQKAKIAKKDLIKVQYEKNRLDNDTKKLQGELQSKSKQIQDVTKKVSSFKQKQEEIKAQVKEKEKELKTAKKNTKELKQSIAKIKELSAVAYKLQQKNQVNEANQFLNIAGLVLQEKIENPELKEALLDSSLVLGYQYLDLDLGVSKNPNTHNTNFINSFQKLEKINSKESAIVKVYSYYVKGKLEENSDKAKAVAEYKKAIYTYEKRIKPEFKSPFDLFTLDINILYNDNNTDILAALYDNLRRLEPSNSTHNELLKKHYFDQLEYVLDKNEWLKATSASWKILYYLMNKEGLSSYWDIKNNLKCADFKRLDELWVTKSQRRFGYSIQKDIFLKMGNVLDFDWDQGKFSKENDYEKFNKKVEWNDNEKKKILQGDIDPNPLNLPKGIFPFDYTLGRNYFWGGDGKTILPVHITLLQQYQDCSKSGF